MTTKRLEELLPASAPQDLDAGELFERSVREEVTYVSGVAMSSGCVSCNNGGGGGSGGTLGYAKDEKTYKE